MAAKERHKQKVKQRIQQRLDAMLLQEESLHSLIRDYVQQAQKHAESLLVTEDTTYFMQQYGNVEQLLDRVNNTCELLSTTAEDMIENAELDVTVKPDISVSINDSSQVTQISDSLTEHGEGTSAAGKVPQKTSTPKGSDHAIKDEDMKMQLQAMLESSREDHNYGTKQPLQDSGRKEIKTKKMGRADTSQNWRNETFTVTEQSIKDEPPNSVFSAKQSNSGFDTKPKRGSKFIPSPVKKQLASYIQKDEIKGNNTETVALPTVEKNNQSVQKKNISTVENIVETPGHIRKIKSTTKTGNRMNKQSLQSKQDTNLVDTETAGSSSTQISEKKMFLPAKTSSKTSTVTSDSSFIEGESESSVSYPFKPPSTKIKQTEENISCKPSNNRSVAAESIDTSREITVNDLVMEQSCLPSGKAAPVVVSDIVSPWCFCVQSNASQVNHLMEQICTYMSTGGLHEKPLQNPNSGQMCLAKFSTDMTFYRAYILHYWEATKEVEVLYVDYGNREKVKTSALRNLPKRFYSLPMQAICCSLAEVMPNNKYLLWTEEDITVFKQYVINQHLTCVQVCRCSTPGIPAIVRLFGSYPMPAVPGGQMFLNQIKIGEVLVSRGSAKYVNTVDQIGHLEKCGEGREESLILNKGASVGNVVEIHEDKVEDKVKSANVKQASKPGMDKAEASKAMAMVYPESDELEVSRMGNLTKHEKDIRKIDQTDDEKSHSVKNATTDDDAMDQNKHLCDRKETDIFLEDCKAENYVPEMLDNYSLDVGSGQIGDGSKARPSLTESDMSESKEKRENTGNSKELTKKSDLGKDRLDEQTHEDKALTDKVKGKYIVQDSETMSSAGTTDRDSERSTDTGFQSTEVTFDLQLDPQGEKVMLAHVRSPSHFYVHVLQAGHTLDLLMKNLNKHFEKMNRRKLTRLSQTFVPVLKKLCCAQFLQDNNFYRAVILKIRSDNEPGVGKVLIHYIDFGDEEWLPKRRLFPLPPQYSSVPPLAIKCKLAYIRPVNETVKTDSDYTWSEDTTKTFIDLMGFEKILHMQVVEGHLIADCKGELVGDNDVTLGVYLVDTTGTEDICANVDLIRLDLAQLDAPARRNLNDFAEININDEMDLKSWNPMEADFLSKRNSYKVDIEDAEMATVGYKSQAHRGVCRYYSKGAHCWRGENCPYRHVQSDSVVPLEREQVYCRDNQSEALPEVNSWVAAEVITILNPGHFYILLPMGNKSLEGTSNTGTQDENANPHCEESLDDLLTALNIEYNKKSPSLRSTQLKAPGEIVVARFSQDKQWYRARVIQVTEEKVKVFYLDFGNTEWLPDEEIAEITPEFLHLPFQAIECFLCNVEPAGDENWTREAKNAFRSLVDGKTLVAHIRSRSWNGCLSVDLYDTSEEEDIHIGERLIENKHAVRTSFLTDTSCNGSISSQNADTNSKQSDVMMFPG